MPWRLTGMDADFASFAPFQSVFNTFVVNSEAIFHILTGFTEYWQRGRTGNKRLYGTLGGVMSVDELNSNPGHTYGGTFIETFGVGAVFAFDLQTASSITVDIVARRITSECNIFQTNNTINYEWESVFDPVMTWDETP